MTDQSTAPRKALILILFALFWVFLIFIGDSIWGDGFAAWMAVGYVLANGVLLAILNRR